MKVMVVGGGAREHALAWKIKKSPKVKELYCAPGNAGTTAIGENLAISVEDIPGLLKAAQERKIDLMVVGPEKPLDLGIVDLCQKAGILALGPTRAATRIESSKVFARRLMLKYDIPCPPGEIFWSFSEARQYLLSQSLPIVIKANGLAAGKGVTIAQSQEEALGDLYKKMIKKVLDDAGDEVIIDKFISGKEVSLIAFTDGKTVVPMVTACDYKRIFDGDEGPMTGGMGSYSPSEFLDEAKIEKIKETVLIPTVRAMAKEGRPYKGLLYAGLIITPEEEVKVFEFNARFGDPETQVQIPRLKTDIIDIILAVIHGTLDQVKIEWSDEACVGVVLASGGYPNDYKIPFLITGFNQLDPEIILFHAGTKLTKDGQIITDGGRVLTVTATGKTLAEARQKVYTNIPRLNFNNCYYRKDIAERSARLSI